MRRFVSVGATGGRFHLSTTPARRKLVKLLRPNAAAPANAFSNRSSSRLGTAGRYDVGSGMDSSSLLEVVLVTLGVTATGSLMRQEATDGLVEAKGGGDWIADRGIGESLILNGGWGERSAVWNLRGGVGAYGSSFCRCLRQDPAGTDAFPCGVPFVLCGANAVKEVKRWGTGYSQGPGAKFGAF